MNKLLAIWQMLVSLCIMIMLQKPIVGLRNVRVALQWFARPQRVKRKASVFAGPKRQAYCGPDDDLDHLTPEQMVKRINKSIKEFQDANDERLTKLEKGDDDGIIKDKVERINADITALQTLAEENAKIVARIGLGEEGAADPLKNEKEARVFLSCIRDTEPGRITAEDIEAYKEYSAVYAKYLRKGLNGISAEMQVGSDPDGGYWAPTQFQTDVIKRLFETSEMRALAQQISITADSITWPTDTNDSSTGGFVGEQATRSETDTPEIGEQTIYVREQYAMPIVTQKLLDMATVDVEAYLAERTADKFIRTENTRFVTGGGVTDPRGFLDYKSTAVATADSSRAWGLLEQILTGANGGFPNVSGGSGSDPDTLIDLVATMNPAYLAGAVFVMRRTVQAAVRKLKDNDGNYMIGPISQGATGFDLLGFPIRTMEDMPALATNSYSIAFGNFRVGYQIVDGRGIRVLRDNLTTKGKVKFYTTKWVGGDVVNFDAIKLLKFAA